VIALLLVAWQAIAAPNVVADGHLEQAQAALAQWPNDYGAAVDYARAAFAAGDTASSVAAWQRAQDLSGGNLEVALGSVAPLVAQDQPQAAVRAAREAVVAAPDLSAAHRALGWARYNQRALPGLGTALAAPAYRAATRLDPHDAVSWCGLGWSRRGLGNTLSGATALQRARALDPSSCTQPSGPSWRTSAAVSGSLVDYSGHPWRGQGSGAEVQAHGRVGQLAFADLAARRVMVRGLGNLVQDEFWLRAGGGHAGAGAAVLVGVLDARGFVTDRATTLGGSAWATWWATLTLSGSTTGYLDARQTQGDGSLRLPLTTALSVAGGLCATALTSTEEDPDIGPPGLSGWGAATLSHQEWVSLTAGARGGREIRPVRAQTLGIWNTSEPLAGSLFARLDAHPTPALTLSSAFEAAWLERPDAPPSRALVGTLGLGITFGGPRPTEEE
jgi:hypothetical protein